MRWGLSELIKKFNFDFGYKDKTKILNMQLIY